MKNYNELRPVDLFGANNFYFVGRLGAKLKNVGCVVSDVLNDDSRLSIEFTLPKDTTIEEIPCIAAYKDCVTFKHVGDKINFQVDTATIREEDTWLDSEFISYLPFWGELNTDLLMNVLKKWTGSDTVFIKDINSLSEVLNHELKNTLTPEQSPGLFPYSNPVVTVALLGLDLNFTQMENQQGVSDAFVKKHLNVLQYEQLQEIKNSKLGWVLDSKILRSLILCPPSPLVQSSQRPGFTSTTLNEELVTPAHQPSSSNSWGQAGMGVEPHWGNAPSKSNDGW